MASHTLTEKRDALTEKKCEGCQQVKPRGEFYEKKQGGLQAPCKECRRKAVAEYSQRQPPEWYEKKKARATVYGQSARSKEARRDHYVANRDRIDQRIATWRAANPERVRENYARNTKRRRELLGGKSLPGIPRRLIREKMTYWANKCWMCGAPGQEVDHVKPAIAGGTHILSNLRPICKVCNRVKGGKWPVSRTPPRLRADVVALP